MTHCVVSHGDTRLLAGMGLGAAGVRNAAMVVLVEEFRLTRPASGSVPVFTDQRSTPHWANNADGTIRRSTTKNKRLRRRCCIIQPPGSSWAQVLAEIIVAAPQKEIQRFVKNRAKCFPYWNGAGWSWLPRNVIFLTQGLSTTA